MASTNKTYLKKLQENKNKQLMKNDPKLEEKLNYRFKNIGNLINFDPST